MRLPCDFAKIADDGAFEVTLCSGPAIDMGVQCNGIEFAKLQLRFMPQGSMSL